VQRFDCVDVTRFSRLLRTPACAASSRDVNWYDGIMRIAPISTAEARPIRDVVLRPGFPPGGTVYPGDDAPDTLHLGAFTAGPLAAVATICREPLPETNSERVWCLRGMATLDQYRGLGLGRELAVACINHARSHCAELIWCSVRLEVAPFYKSLGFAETGEPFALPQYSDHRYILMTRVP